MTRRRALASMLSNEEQSLQAVWGWYEFQRALVGEEKSRIFTALVGGMDLTLARYLGKTWEELDSDFAYHLAELGQLTMLGMLASTEAALRVDFIERVAHKDKDLVSRRFRKICKQQNVERV